MQRHVHLTSETSKAISGECRLGPSSCGSVPNDMAALP